MIKIGIIGTQSMHSREFAKACNIPNEKGEFLIPDCRVTAVCGIDDISEHIRETAELGAVPFVVNEPAELFELCNAIIVATRDGHNHVSYALPFLKKGYPVFLDKPVCITNEEIELLDKAVKSIPNSIIDGGSGMKHNKSLMKLKARIDNGAVGNVRGISLNHNANIKDPNNGIFFYACHAVEMMKVLLGDEIDSIETSVLDDSRFSVFVKYSDTFANLVFTEIYKDYFVTVYGDENNISYKLDPSDIFIETMKHFAKRVREKDYSDSIDDLVAHVRILQAIDASILRKGN